jgi:hypothetical protein
MSEGASFASLLLGRLLLFRLLRLLLCAFHTYAVHSGFTLLFRLLFFLLFFLLFLFFLCRLLLFLGLLRLLPDLLDTHEAVKTQTQFLAHLLALLEAVSEEGIFDEVLNNYRVTSSGCHSILSMTKPSKVRMRSTSCPKYWGLLTLMRI